MLSKTDKFKNRNHRFDFHWKKNDDYGVRVLARVQGKGAASGDETPEYIHREMKFSLLICTIPEREAEFERLWHHLFLMWNGLPYSIQYRMEVIAVSDERRMTIGEKRNVLLDMASGDYVAFLDDDDWVDEMYFMKIWGASLKDPDCIGFRILCENYPAPGRSKEAICGKVSERSLDWREETDLIYRPPYHKTPVRRRLACEARFPDKSFGEDAEYARRLRGKVKSVEFIDEVLYIYNAPIKPNMKRYGQRN